MKRLRTLSIKNPAALNRRCHFICWGSAYWIQLQAKRLEEQKQAAIRYAHEHIMPRMREEVERALMPDAQRPRQKVVH